MSYGEALKRQRELKGISQYKLAKLTGISQQMLSHWEANKGVPGVDFCEILADFYEISIDELIGRKMIKKITENKD